jgi:hypothetical protein
VRELFTTEDALRRGTTEATLRWGAKKGRWRRLIRGVYGLGPQQASALDVARAEVLRKDATARGRLAGVLHGLDSVVLGREPVRRDELPPKRVVIIGGVRCADGLQTLLDLAVVLDDLTWEQALESALRKGLTTIAAIEAAVARTPGAARIRRVLALRPPGAPPTESLLETVMVQLARNVEGLVAPTRQY